MGNKYKDTLVLIPARAGSVRLKGKNIKPFDGKPLIRHTIDFALTLFEENDIYISSDDTAVLDMQKIYPKANFIKRPSNLAESETKTEEVMFHAIEYAQEMNQRYSNILLLQPTSPFRDKSHFISAYEKLQSNNIEGVLSVQQKKKGFIQSLAVIDAQGNLKKAIDKSNLDRDYFEINGSLYLLKIKAFKQYKLIPNFSKIGIVEMDSYHSLDIDTQQDWDYCEFLLSSAKLK